MRRARTLRASSTQDICIFCTFRCRPQSSVNPSNRAIASPRRFIAASKLPPQVSRTLSADSDSIGRKTSSSKPAKSQNGVLAGQKALAQSGQPQNPTSNSTHFSPSLRDIAQLVPQVDWPANGYQRRCYRSGVSVQRNAFSSRSLLGLDEEEEEIPKRRQDSPVRFSAPRTSNRSRPHEFSSRSILGLDENPPQAQEKHGPPIPYQEKKDRPFRFGREQQSGPSEAPSMIRKIVNSFPPAEDATSSSTTFDDQRGLGRTKRVRWNPDMGDSIERNLEGTGTTQWNLLKRAPRPREAKAQLPPAPDISARPLDQSQSPLATPQWTDPFVGVDKRKPPPRGYIPMIKQFAGPVPIRKGKPLDFGLERVGQGENSSLEIDRVSQDKDTIAESNLKALQAARANSQHNLAHNPPSQPGAKPPQYSNPASESNLKALRAMRAKDQPDLLSSQQSSTRHNQFAAESRPIERSPESRQGPSIPESAQRPFEVRRVQSTDPLGSIRRAQSSNDVGSFVPKVVQWSPPKINNTSANADGYDRAEPWPSGRADRKSRPTRASDADSELSGRPTRSSRDNFDKPARSFGANLDLDSNPSKRSIFAKDDVRDDKPKRRHSRRDIDEDDEDDNRRVSPRLKAKDKARRKQQWGEEEEDGDSRESRESKQRKKAKERHVKWLAAQSRMKPIHLPEFISVSNLAHQVGARYENFVKRMEQLGFTDIGYDHVLTAENAGLIAMEYGYEPVIETIAEGTDIHPEPLPEDMSQFPQRPPVVTIMGHVDHGKTTLLDFLRKSSVVATEHGGITQHIGAFSVAMSSGKIITFLDTPGHAAFLSMRERGANVTDIVILVVAADDSVMPQTLEAIKHARAANVPMIVALNKVDKGDANIERVKQDLARHGVEVEDFGGDVQAIPVSGKTGQGMDMLEEAVVTLSEILDHRAPPDGNVEGWVLESATKKAGKVATVLVRRGTLRPGDIIVAGRTYARVRTLKNEAGIAVEEAGPGTPVEVDGWRGQPGAGDEVLQAPDEQKASRVVEYRKAQFERIGLATDMEAINKQRKLDQERREREEALEKLKKMKEDGVELPENGIGENEEEATGPRMKRIYFILKADVAGSVEAVVNAVSALGNNEIRPHILRSGVGAVSQFDIDHAATANGHIIAFNTTLDPKLGVQAEKAGVQVIDQSIIYRLVEDVTKILTDALPPLITQRVVGEAAIAQIFEISVKGRKSLPVAGCKIRNGVVSRTSKVKVLRGREVIFDGLLSSLKNQKKDAVEMRKGNECGMSFEGWHEFEVGDQVQAYEEKEEKRTL